MAANEAMIDEATSLAMAIARGEDPIRRIVTMRWFTFDVDGEDVVLGDELKAAIEAIGGSKLVEATPEQYQGERVLRFADVALATQRLFAGVAQG